MSSQRSASAPVGGHGEVVAVAPLGDQQAEVERRPGDPLRRVVRAPRPGVAARAGELDAERPGRRLQPVCCGRRSRGCGRRCGPRAAAGRSAPGRRRARRRRPARAPRSPSAARWPSRWRSSAGRTRGAWRRWRAGPPPAWRGPARQPASRSAGVAWARRDGGLVDEAVAQRRRHPAAGRRTPRGRSRRRWRPRRSRPDARSGGRSSSPRAGVGRAHAAAGSGATSASSALPSAARSASTASRSATGRDWQRARKKASAHDCFCACRGDDARSYPACSIRTFGTTSRPDSLASVVLTRPRRTTSASKAA